MIDAFIDNLAPLAIGALIVILVQVLIRLGGNHLGDRNSYERRWSRLHRAQRRELARLQKKGTR